ncbi:ABC transporter permease [Kineosporia sp. J2-2]|uniref:ABC transporter permease n=1 Tax=Kineosporia corallincola TaxID=2835133 RepID=A0ABS5THD0_9ACTN|nr:hypothetical protein [Kineosporia corallincola]MBT0769586.1 ABC transporter permease [Kineosporia corallincola]
MLRLLVRRARASWPLLAAVVAVVTVGATLLGVSARLLTVSADRALTVGLSRADPQDAEVIAYLSDLTNENAQQAAELTQNLLGDAVSPLGPGVSRVRASSTMRRVEDRGNTPQAAYLTGLDDLTAAARLIEGAWPSTTATGPLQTVVLESTARAMRLEPGSRVHLGAQVAAGDRDRVDSTDLLVTGIVAPLPEAGWDRDPLAAAGSEAALRLGFHTTFRAYGPFVTDLPTLWRSGLMLDRMQVATAPDLTNPPGAALDQVVTRLATADRRLGDQLEGLTENQRVASGLPATLARARTQQAVTRSTVLVVVLLGTLLTATALALAGRLVTRSRGTQTALLSTLGAGRGQLLLLAVGEALGLALVASVIAVPASSLVHAALTHLPALEQAGLAAGPGVSPAQVAVILAGAVVLALVLLLPVLQADPARVEGTRGGAGVLVRSGADLALVALAAVGWWQLRVQPVSGEGVDLVRILAPGVFLLAGSALTVRLTGLPLRLADRLARRSTRLVLPLAAFEAARRPQATAAALLLVLAVAAGTFGLAFGATWQRSQADQADLVVGTDVSVALAGSVQTGQGPALAAATGGTVSPVLDRDVPVGQWIGGAGDPPHLVALDASQAGTLLRGRLPGASWEQIGAGLTAGSATVSSVVLGGQGTVEMSGTADAGPPMLVTPRLVIEDGSGVRSACVLPTVLLDGTTHELGLCDALPEGARVVAMTVDAGLDPATAPPADEVTPGNARLELSFRIPGSADGGEWTASNYGGETGARVSGVSGEVESSGDGVVLELTATVPVIDLAYADGRLVMTGFEPPEVVPVAVSQEFADVLGAAPGDRFDVSFGLSSVPVRVTAVVPDVPSAPGRGAMLADIDTLGRALIARGDLAAPGNTWWVARATDPGAVRTLGLGKVTTRDAVYQELSKGPLRAGVPAALFLLVPAVLLLALGGLTLHIVSDLRVRAGQTDRLRALGLPRRTVRGLLLAQHGGLLVLLVAAGAVVGAVATRLVGPLLIRSDLGAPPIPGPLVVWPWFPETVLVFGLLAACLVVVRAVAQAQVRR